MEPDFPLNGSDDDAEALCDAPERTAATSSLLSAFVGALSVLIACGNSLVIVSVMYFKQLHTPTNCLILSLAAADLLVGVVVLPFSAALSAGSCWPLSGLLCKIRGAVDVSLCSCSILNLCFISADRYFIVFRPLAYRARMTASVTGLMILASWALPVLFAAITSIPAPAAGAADARCNMFLSSRVAVFGVIFTSFLPAIVIFSLYMKILAVARRQARRLQDPARSGPSVSSRMESKATKTLAIVVGIYLCCWSPFFLSVSLYPLTSALSPVPVIEAFKWLGWSNSMFNPFVYGFFYKWFRTAFRLILCGKIFQSDCSNMKLS